MQIESTIRWEFRAGIVGCGRAIDKPPRRNSILRMEFGGRVKTLPYGDFWGGSVQRA